MSSGCLVVKLCRTNPSYISVANSLQTHQQHCNVIEWPLQWCLIAFVAEHPMQPIRALLAHLRTASTVPVVCLCFRTHGCEVATATLSASGTSQILSAQHVPRPPTVSALTDIINDHKAQAVLLGGPGAFRMDGRLHFGVRALVNQLVGDPSKPSHALAASPQLPVPVYTWYDVLVDV